jgi:hypothetical protein
VGDARTAIVARATGAASPGLPAPFSERVTTLKSGLRGIIAARYQMLPIATQLASISRSATARSARAMAPPEDQTISVAC